MILDRFRLDDKVAIVTGAGRGIGAATAIALAQAGADVVISARTAEQLDKVVAQVEAAGRRAVVRAGQPQRPRRRGRTRRPRPGRLRPTRPGRQQRRAAPCPRPSWTRRPRSLEDAFHFNVATAHTLLQRRRPADGRARRRVGGQHLVGHGPHGRPRLRRLRHGQGRAGPLHPPGGHGPRPPDPGERHRRRLGRHLGPRHRHAGRRDAGRPWRRPPPWVASAIPRTSPRPSSTCRPMPAPT